ncbi:MAG: gluconate 2-dehydrogenase subunit 3 family protein [Alphaproteobacteria bacterium]|nr:gluconate 2-dehydrogenase subunit 3 family protein [Alphaproteobacteria bacterium]MBU1516902.1 gluconate 2-dehydrogenase subunit 3 family protein [Alphaproteobacteria bacterium]MBU2092597.1 gluconate 2-dehydrogenase subunit 3 family protein [Alphaproteobacteria bacterium]MBU2151292.1 gluconate 2-dehydrogenase subunit 3 family protein [Alphaproteobacteria bacterium]MBU2309594.1 gluconate 2-dehydrogenase subunit 3 family protein [Alphaproteobacteria bacterium]
MLLTRRDAALTFGALWTALVLPAGALAQTTSTLSWTPKALSADQARTLDAVAELIIPATDTPGARAAGVPQFVDRALTDYYDPADGARYKAGLDQIDRDARAAHGAAFVALTGAQQLALLTRYDTEGMASFRALKELVTIGYFTSEPGATIALRYDPVPGDYHGCVPLKDIGRAWATT